MINFIYLIYSKVIQNVNSETKKQTAYKCLTSQKYPSFVNFYDSCLHDFDNQKRYQLFFIFLIIYLKNFQVIAFKFI